MLTVGINIIMLLIHDKDFFLLNDSTPVEYTFKQNLVDVGAIYIPKNKQNFCGVIDLMDDP